MIDFKYYIEKILEKNFRIFKNYIFNKFKFKNDNKNPIHKNGANKKIEIRP